MRSVLHARREASRAVSVALLATFAAAGCGGMRLPRTIEVRVTDDALRAPERIPPGPSLVHVTNAGSGASEVRVVTFAQGISPDSGRALLALDVIPDALVEPSSGTLRAPAGATAAPQLYLELMTGRVYGFVAAREGAPARYAVLVAQEEQKR